MNAGRRFHDRSALKQWELHFGPNMTPMVDIVMVILIFFMAGSTLVGPEWFLRAAVPRPPGSGGEGSAAASDPFELPPARFEIDLRVDASGRTVVDGLGLAGGTPEDLAAPLGELRGVRNEAVVLIRPGAAVPYRDVVLVRDLCERAGIGTVGLLPPPDISGGRSGAGQGEG